MSRKREKYERQVIWVSHADEERQELARNMCKRGWQLCEAEVSSSSPGLVCLKFRRPITSNARIFDDVYAGIHQCRDAHCPCRLLRNPLSDPATEEVAKLFMTERGLTIEEARACLLSSFPEMAQEGEGENSWG